MAMQGNDPLGTLVARPAGQLFGRNLARVAFKRGTYLRQFVLRFAELLSDRLTADLIQKTMNGTPDNYTL
jgi:LysR family cys regulon transcriptional activator